MHSSFSPQEKPRISARVITLIAFSFVLPAGFLVAACSSATTGSSGDGCMIAAEDSVYLRQGNVYRDCAVDRRARLLTPNVRVDYQPSSRPRAGTVCYFAHLQFVVNANGIPEISTASITRTNEQRFAEAALASLPSWRYEPALKDGEPVRQIVSERKIMALSVVIVGSGQAKRPPPPSACS